MLMGFRLIPRAARRRVALAMSRRRPGSRLARAADAHGGLAGAYAAMRGLFAPVEVENLFPAAPRLEARPASVDGGPGAGAAERIGLMEMARYLPDQLLRDTDAVSMAHSLEVRVPLLDDLVVNVALALPARTRLAPNKRLLSLATVVGPAQLKRPFTLPFEAWTRGQLRPWVREGLLSDQLPLATELRAGERGRLWRAFEAGRAHWSRPWAIAVLRHWPAANGLRW
jgi:asparagine synthase (glutamine-hydrolysing)